MKKIILLLFLCSFLQAQEQFQNIQNPFSPTEESVLKKDFIKQELERLTTEAQVIDKKRQYEKEKRIYEKILEKDPKKEDLLLKLGQIYSNLDEIDKAEKVLKKYLKTHPEDEDARLLLAIVYYREKKYDLAEKLVNIVIKNDPNDPDAYLLLGRIYFAYDLPVLAEETFLKAIKLAPDRQDIFLPLAQSQLKLQHYEGAYKNFVKALSFDKGSETIIKNIIDIKYYVKPSLSASFGIAQEIASDIDLKIKVLQLDYSNAQGTYFYPINDVFQPYVGFEYEPTKEKNIVIDRYYYRVNQYYPYIGSFFNFLQDWAAQLEFKLKRSENESTNIFPLKTTTRFQPSFATKYTSPAHFFIARAYVDSFLAKNYIDITSYLVNRYQITSLYEYRFAPPLSGVGINGYLAWYDAYRKNKKAVATGWIRLGKEYFKSYWSMRYQYDYKKFEKIYADYTTYDFEQDNLLKFTFFKEWLPYTQLELTYSSLWRNTKDQVDEATLGLPTLLRKHHFHANTVAGRFNRVFKTSYHVNLFGNYYWNTDKDTSWLVKTTFRWVF